MIQVIDRTFKILEELSLDGIVSLDSLVRCTGLNKGTLCNILRSLIELGYVRRVRSAHYSLTDKVMSVQQSQCFLAHELEHIHRCVESLAQTTQESGVLTMLRGHQVSIVHQAQYQRILMINAGEVYAALSLFHSTSGRVLVAFMTEEERERIVDELGFPGQAWSGISSWDELENACKGIRKNEVCIMENKAAEIIAFSVPVFWSESMTLALGLTMPLQRCPRGKRDTILKSLKEHAGMLAEVSHGGMSPDLLC